MFNKSNINQNIIKYWEEKATQNISWFNKWTQTFQAEFSQMNLNWFVGAGLNVCYNCVDRHLENHKDKTAILWEGNEVNDSKKLTYYELYIEICKFANVLKKLGVKKGDKICIYMPMIPEAIIAMLAAARIGAVHSVVFAGFSAEALKTRILDANCSLIITADGTKRGTKQINLLENVEHAIDSCPNIEYVVVINHLGQKININKSKYKDYHTEMSDSSTNCKPENMLATDPLFILYTSGSTGKPKGVLHNCGGYIVYVCTTFKEIFSYDDSDIYWCSADIGWITGHSYLVYGPLANAATTLIYEGIPNYPTFSRFWEIIDKYKVNQFYTSPTALRALRKEGDEHLESSNLSSLKVLGVVGEPLNPDVWDWFYEKIGKKNCPIVNTWWQTETGGIMLSPKPIKSLDRGSVGNPINGTDIDIIDDAGNSIINSPNKVGKLVIKQPWPGLMHTIYGDHNRFINNYFSEFKGLYYTGDDAYCDQDGNFWITGRNDDVINVSGHRISTAEIESAFLTHFTVAEAAVVGVKHPIKGESIYAFITLKSGIEPSANLKQQLIKHIRDTIGAFSAPETIQFANALPKTRSGKIMRRILRKIANKDFQSLGDLSTLAEPNIINELIENII